MDSEKLLGVEPKSVWPIADVAAWLAAVADGRWSWTNNSQCKYVTLHIDTRRGAYLIEDRDNVATEPFAVLRQGMRQLDLPTPENGLREALERANEKVCMDCAGHNPVWFAPNKVWNLVIGGPDANDDPGGFYCPVCFIRRAEASGFVPTGWELRPEEIDGETHLQARNEGVEEPQGTAAHVRGKDHQAAPGSAAAETQISALSALQHNTGERDALPDDVRALVIAAREFWDIHDSPADPESRALDQALEAFAGRVPFADEPALSQAPR